MKRALRSRVLSVVLAAAVALTSFALPGAVKQGKAYYNDDGSYYDPGDKDWADSNINKTVVTSPSISLAKTYESNSNVEEYEYQTSTENADSYANENPSIRKDKINGTVKIFYQYSNNRDFKSNHQNHQYTEGGVAWSVNTGSDDDDPKFKIPADPFDGALNPGETVYVRAYTYKEFFEKSESKGIYYINGTGDAQYYTEYNQKFFYSDYNEPLTFTVKVDNAIISDTIIKSKSIALKFSTDTNANGFIIYRKSGKGKYKQIAKTNKFSYVDKGLTKGKRYSYKVRAYYYGTGQYQESSQFVYTSALTAGACLDLRLGASGKKNNKIKLSWKKVKGAKKYVIYRRQSNSDADKKKDQNDNSFSTWEKVKTLKKKKKSWTDTKVNLNESDGYSYEVRAYLSGSIYVLGEAGIDFKFNSPNVQEQQLGNSTVLAYWNKVPSAIGYQVTRVDTTYDKETGIHSSENVVAELGKNQTSIKLSAVAGHDSTTYRIYSKKEGNVLSYYETVEVSQYIDATSATAVPTANGIQVSWTPVPGATYYTVTRLTAADLGVYNANTKTYEIRRKNYGTEVRRINQIQDYPTAYLVEHNTQTETKHIVYDGRTVDEDNTVSTVGKVTLHYSDYRNDTYSLYHDSDYSDSDEGLTGYYYYQYDGDDGYSRHYIYLDNNGNYYVSRYNYYTGNYRVDVTLNLDNPDNLSDDDHVIYDFGSDQKYIEKRTAVHSYATEPIPAGQRDFIRPDNEITGTSVLDQYVKFGTNEGDYVGPQPGVTYYYIVTAHNDSGYDYHGYDAKSPESNVLDISSYGVKNIASASWGVPAVNAPKTSVKKLKAKKNSVKVKIKKSNAAGAEYIIYRSTSKKKGSFQVAGYTNKTTFTDTGLNKGTKYYYKVATSVRNSAGQYITSKASKVKKVKTKGKKAKAGSKKSKAKSKAKKSGSKKKSGKKNSKKKSGKKKK